MKPKRQLSRPSPFLKSLFLINVQPEEVKIETVLMPETARMLSPRYAGANKGKGDREKVVGLLDKCEDLQREVKGELRETTRSLTFRKEKWAQTKAYLSDMNSKAAWRESPLYQHRKALITQRLLVKENPAQEQDKRVILTAVSPERSGQRAFLTIDQLTQARLKSLSQVSKREFGLQPLTPTEVLRNLQYTYHPTVRLLSPTEPTHRRAQTHLGILSPEHENLKKPHFQGKPLLRFMTETRILDQMVKNRIVKMQRNELLA